MSNTVEYHFVCILGSLSRRQTGSTFTTTCTARNRPRKGKITGI